MPFEKHPDLALPENLDATIWRHIDFTKFISLLETKSLYFSRLDILAQVNPFEGSYSKKNLEAESLSYAQKLPEDWAKIGIHSEHDFDIRYKHGRIVREANKSMREFIFVNSWHLGEHESAAMWRLYLNGNEGICIKSTCQGLIDSVSNYNTYNVYVGLVKYANYDADFLPTDNLLKPYFFKRRSFEHEREIRALIWTLANGKNDLKANKHANDKGIYVDVDLNTLIKIIHVSPAAPYWLEELVRSVTARYGLAVEVKKSDLASGPLY